MTDLRTRIAKALYGQIISPVPLFDSQPDEVKDAWLKDADAVIAALGLKKESEMALDDTYKVIPMHRYVTEWTDGI